MNTPDDTSHTDRADQRIDALLRQPSKPSADFVERTLDAARQTPRTIAFPVWIPTLAGLAAATVIGAFAFYLLFSNAPENRYVQRPQVEQASPSAPLESNGPWLALSSARTPYEDLLYVDEVVRPVPDLHEDSWMTIEALLY